MSDLKYIMDQIDNMSKYKIVFMNHCKMRDSYKWYDNLNNFYQKILEKNFNVSVQSFFNNDNQINAKSLKYFQKNISSENLYIFNPVDFAHLLIRNKHHNLITEILKKINYIVIWQEILLSNCDIIGYHEACQKKAFIFEFFSNSKLNLVSNFVSMESLTGLGINHNRYFIMTGYSEINNIVPFVDKNESKIDVLIYGSLHKSLIYRLKFIRKLMGENKKYKIHACSGVFNESLDLLLKQTKIVVHVPSHSNLEHMPWPKITYLQSRKVFFIIEDNKELHMKDLDKFVPHYPKNNVRDLFLLIDHYLSNPQLYQDIIEKNYQYITQNANIDVAVPEIVNDVLSAI